MLLFYTIVTANACIRASLPRQGERGSTSQHPSPATIGATSSSFTPTFHGKFLKEYDFNFISACTHSSRWFSHMIIRVSCIFYAYLLCRRFQASASEVDSAASTNLKQNGIFDVSNAKGYSTVTNNTSICHCE